MALSARKREGSSRGQSLAVSCCTKSMLGCNGCLLHVDELRAINAGDFNAMCCYEVLMRVSMGLSKQTLWSNITAAACTCLPVSSRAHAR